MFDFYGVSQRVAAVRMSPWRWIGGQNGHYENHGDKFNESYTYGPVGLTTRTVETEDADPGDNFDHWVLPDVFGGTTGLLAKVGTGAREPVFEHFDAFGVRAEVDSTWSDDYDASRYRWRSQEGSETDDLAINDSNGLGLQPPTLVTMQTRHYDPGLGRFIMADSIPMGAFSPQGLNRYAYCTNDPVNLSDPKGEVAPLLVLIAIAFLLAAAFGYGIMVYALSIARTARNLGQLGIYGDALEVATFSGGVASIYAFIGGILFPGLGSVPGALRACLLVQLPSDLAMMLGSPLFVMLLLYIFAIGYMLGDLFYSSTQKKDDRYEHYDKRLWPRFGQPHNTLFADNLGTRGSLSAEVCHA